MRPFKAEMQVSQQRMIQVTQQLSALHFGSESAEPREIDSASSALSNTAGSSHWNSSGYNTSQHGKAVLSNGGSQEKSRDAAPVDDFATSSLLQKLEKLDDSQNG